MLWRQDLPASQSGHRVPGASGRGRPYGQQPHQQPRPMGHGHSARYEHLASEDAGARQAACWSAGRPESRPGELAQWQSGEQRVALRRHFNVKELDVVQIVGKYDADRSKVLELPELRHLLQDYNGGRPPREDEINFILKVADRNRDNRISQDEILFALRTWFAYNHMPTSVGHAFSKYGFSGGPMPSPESFRGLLLALNEHQPVEEEEAATVRAMAVRLSGSETRVTLEQLRQAVATWYLNIERGQTPHMELLGKAAVDAHKRIFDMTKITLLFKGECNYKARGTLVLGIVLIVFLAVFPCLDILMADLFPTDWRCEHPHMSFMIWATGVLGLTLFLGVSGAIAATHFKLATVKILMWVFVVVISVVMFIVTLLGANDVVWSSSGRCGLAIWHFAHLMWIEVPVLVMMFLCCGLPVMYGVMGSQAFIKSQELDHGLMNP